MTYEFQRATASASFPRSSQYDLEPSDHAWQQRCAFAAEALLAGIACVRHNASMANCPNGGYDSDYCLTLAVVDFAGFRRH